MRVASVWLDHNQLPPDAQYHPAVWEIEGELVGQSDNYDIYAGTTSGQVWCAVTYPGMYRGRDALMQFVKTSDSQCHELIDYIDLQEMRNQ